MIKKETNREMKDPNYKPYEKKRKILDRLAQNKFNNGSWKKQQQRLFVEYLFKFKETFLTSKSKIENKVFVNMSKFINTRASHQCQSHYQKMCKKYGNMDCVIDGVRNDIVFNSNFNDQSEIMNQIFNSQENIKIEFIQNENKEEIKKDHNCLETNHEICTDWRENKRKRLCKGIWKQQQQRLFVQFLSNFKQALLTRKLKRQSKIFLNMSQFIKTRSRAQCRSHYYHLNRFKYGNTDRVIKGIKKDKLQNQKPQMKRNTTDQIQYTQEKVKIQFIQDENEEQMKKNDKAWQTNRQLSIDLKKEEINIKVEKEYSCKKQEQHIYQIQMRQGSVWKLLDSFI